MSKMTPLRAIRRKCLWCCGDSRQEVRLCPATQCPLWPLRMGTGHEGTPLSPLAAIRAKCLDCVGGIMGGIRSCDVEILEGPCSLHPFRMGKLPEKQRKRSRAFCEAARRRALEMWGKRRASPEAIPPAR